MENITLYYCQGGSDKVYQASIESSGEKYVVRYAYGRRGTTLQTGVKTALPITYEHAKQIYTKLIAEKLAKGYTPGESGTPYQQTDRSSDATGILPQLLNPIESVEASRFIADAAWCLQEKFDGKRILIRKRDTTVEGVNRNGLIVALPKPIEEAAQRVPESFIIDGECIGDKLIAFDLLELNGVDHRHEPYLKRLGALLRIVPGDSSLAVADTMFGTPAKAEMLQRLRTENKEGAVFKRIAAPYSVGRPASGGDALKFKFYETASFLVTRVNRQRSVNVGLMRGGELVPAGRVTIPPNHPVPTPGVVIEARYLYAYPESGSIYQPVYLGVRSDIGSDQCTVSQLKFKNAMLQEAA